MAVAGDDRAVGAGVGVGLAVERADHQRLGDHLARDQRRGAPAERERRALGGAAEGVGGGGGQADARAGGVDAVALGDRFEEGALVGGGPAIVAAGLGGVGGRRRGPAGGAVMPSIGVMTVIAGAPPAVRVREGGLCWRV